MGRIPREENPEYRSPREEFLYGEEYVSVEAIAERWSGRPKSEADKPFNGKRYEKEGILELARIEDWVRERRLLRESLSRERSRRYRDRLAELDADELIEATKFHRNTAQSLLAFYQSHVQQVPGGARFVDGNGEDLRCTVGDLIRAAEKGILLERRLLGFVDEVVKIQHVESVTQDVVEVIAKYVEEPAVLRSIGADLEQRLARRYENLEEIKRKG